MNSALVTLERSPDSFGVIVSEYGDGKAVNGTSAGGDALGFGDGGQLDDGTTITAGTLRVFGSTEEI
jgi:hypothetical protein